MGVEHGSRGSPVDTPRRERNVSARHSRWRSLGSPGDCHSTSDTFSAFELYLVSAERPPEVPGRSTFVDRWVVPTPGDATGTIPGLLDVR